MLGRLLVTFDFLSVFTDLKMLLCCIGIGVCIAKQLLANFKVFVHDH